MIVNVFMCVARCKRACDYVNWRGRGRARHHHHINARIYFTSVVNFAYGVFNKSFKRVQL